MNRHPGGLSWLLNSAMLLDRSRSFLRLLKSPIDTAAFHLLRRRFLPQASPEKTLLLLRVDGIGDLLFFAQYLESLRIAYKDHKVLLICRKEAAELAGELEGLDDIIPLDARRYQWNFFYRTRFLRHIRSRRPETTFYLSYHRRHIGDEIALLSGARSIVAFSGNNEIIRQRIRTRNNKYYTTLVDVPDHSPEREKYRILFDSLRIPVKPTARPVVRVPVSGPIHPVAVIAPGSTSAMRRWPPERFVEVADAVASQHGLRVVLCGDDGQYRLLRSISGMMKAPCKIVSNSSMREVIALIQASRIFIGNDSGLLHVAATLGTAAIGIVGGGHFSRYFPYGRMEIVSNPLPCFECNWKCQFRKAYCVADIPVKAVISHVHRILAKGEV